VQINPIPAIGVMPDMGSQAPKASSFADAMGAAADALTSALSHADALAGDVASGKGSIAEAAIARAKADVMLEVAAVAASRVSGTISVLLQTQA
jgi:flagellar hook-basal body complex protein FliE